MATNELDALVQETFGRREIDPSAQAIEDMKRENVTRLKTSVRLASDVVPERKAEAMKLAERMKLPTAFVENNFDELSKSDQSKAVDFDRIIEDSPELSHWLGNPDNAGLVKDDLPQAQKLADSIKEYGAMESMYLGLMSGMWQATSAVSKAPAFIYDVAALPQNALMKAVGRPDLQVSAPDWLRDNTVARVADRQAQGINESLPEMSADIIGLIGSGDFSKAARSLAVQFAANLPQQATTIAFAAAGAPMAGLVTTGITTGASANDQSRDVGVDPTKSTVNAITQGTAEAMFESLGTIPLLRKWESAIAKQYGKDVSKKVIVDMAKTLGASFVQEGSEEMATQAVQSFSDYAAGANPDMTFGSYAKDIANAGIIGGFSGVGMTSPSGVAMTAARIHQIKTATRAVDFHTAIGQAVLDSKLMKRLPKAQQNLVETLTKDGPVENVYMPVEAVESYFQSKKLDPLAAAQSLGFAQELSEAKETGGDVRVALGKFVTNLVETEHYQGLAKDIKYAPEAMTLREAEESDKTLRADLKLLEKDSEAADQTKPTPLEAMSPEERRVVSAREVKKNVYDQLVAMENPLIGPKEAKQMSLLHAQGMLSLASRTGQDPMELFKRYGLQIQTAEGPIDIGGQDVVRSEPDATAVSEDTTEDIEIQRDDSGAIIYDVGNLAALRRVISDSEIVQGTVKRDDEGYAQGFVGGTSTFPEFFKNKGYTKQAVLKAIDKQTAGEALTEKQREIIDDLYSGYIDSLNRGQFYQGSKARTLFQSSAAQAVVDQLVETKSLGHGFELFQSEKKSGPVDPTKYFENPDGKGDVELPRLPPLVLEKLGVEDKPVVISERVAKKNLLNHPELKPSDGEMVLREAIYNPTSVVQTQKTKRPNYFQFVHEDEKSQVSVIEINVNKDRYEVVNWYQIGKRQLKQLKKSAKGEDGQILITEGDVSQGAAGLSALTLSQFPDDTSANSKKQQGQFKQGDASEAGPRGRIVIGSNKTMRIDLFAKADLSTFLHETGHFYLEVLKDLSKDPKASAQLQSDMGSILNWFGVKSWDDVTTEHHEQWARAFELYLAKGKAPTSELREAFANFKVWLTNIYKNLLRLDVELTPEIKGVMDRLMATDEQLAEAVRGQPSLFSNPLEIGMSKEMAEKYKKLENDAKRAANEELTAKAVKHEMQKREVAYKAARKEVMAGIEAQANEMRVFKALAILQRGKMPDGSDLPNGVQAIKIDRQSIVDAYGKEALDKLPRPYVYAKDGGVHFNVAAEMLGYESGDALIKSISEMPSKKDYVERETEREMAVRFPDEIMNSFPEEAVKAAHADPKRKVLRFELEFLAKHHPALLKDAIKRVAKRVPSEAEVKAQAQKLVAGKRIEEIRPYQFQRAEVKSAKEAGVLLAKGDLAGAFEAKRRELLNYELYRAAVEAQEFVEKSENLFAKLKQKDEDLAKTRDTDLINVARAILAAHGLGKTDKTPEQYLENMKRYDPENYESAIAVIQNAGLVPGPYREITFDEFTNMSDTVKALWDLSKQARSIEIDGRRVDREVVKAELESRIDAIKDSGQRPGYDKAVTEWEKTKMKLLGMRASLRRVESWVSAVDGDNGGVFRKYVWNPISEATAKYRIEKVKVLTQWQEVVKEWAGESDSLSTPIRAENLGYTFAGKAELMAAILHTGNDSNFEKLLLGRNWGERLADGTVDRSRWNEFIAKQWRDGVLTKADYDFAQKVWDLNESLKPDAQKAHKAMYGFYFNEVTAHRFDTPFGSYRGGYVPAMTDMVMVEDSAIRQEQESMLKQNNSSMFPTTGRGFTKSRVEQYTAPLSLDLRQVGSHLDKVLRFIHIEPKVKEVARIVMDKGFRGKLAELDPTIGAEMLVPWLQRSAQQNVSTASKGWAGRGIDAFAKELRKRTGLQTMFFNVTNTIQQITGFTIAAVKVRPKYLRTAFAQYLKGPGDFAKDVASKSQFMETRTATQVMEVNKIIDDISLNPSKFDDFKTFVQEHGYFMQSAAQNLVDLTVWSGAYNQAVEQGVSERDAVRAADNAVRETQGSMNPEDMSRFEGGSPFVRLFTMFYSYFNMQANLLGTEFVKTTRDFGLKRGAGRLLYIYMMGFMLPAVLSDLLVKAMGSGLDEDDDEQYLDDMLSTFFSSQFSTATAMFPIVGPVVKSAVNTLNDKPYDDKLTTSPAVSMIESAVKSPLSVYKAIADGGSKKAAIRDSMSAIGLLTGIPTGPIQKPASYLADVSEGEADPTGPIDFTRGLVTGKPGSAQ